MFRSLLGEQDRAFAFLIDLLLDMLDQQISACHQGFDLAAAEDALAFLLQHFPIEFLQFFLEVAPAPPN